MDNKDIYIILCLQSKVWLHRAAFAELSHSVNCCECILYLIKSKSEEECGIYLKILRRLFSELWLLTEPIFTNILLIKGITWRRCKPNFIKIYQEILKVQVEVYLRP